MPDVIQGGQEPLPSNAQQGGNVPEPSNEPSPVQSVEPSQGGNQPDLVATVRGLQSVVDRMQVQLLQQQQFVQQPVQQPQVQQGNPYDPSTHPTEYWRYENKTLAEQTAQLTEKRIFGAIEQAAKQQQEAQWQQNHPGVDINYVKAWGQVNGVTNLDHCLTLMGLPNQIQNVQQQTYNQVFQQARQPVNTAAPLPQGGQPPMQQPKVSFEALLTQWNQNPKIEDTWSPELKAAFEQELNYRASQQRRTG